MFSVAASQILFANLGITCTVASVEDKGAKWIAIVGWKPTKFLCSSEIIRKTCSQIKTNDPSLSLILAVRIQVLNPQKWNEHQGPQTRTSCLIAWDLKATRLKFMGLTQPVAGYPHTGQKNSIQWFDICRYYFFLTLVTGWNSKVWPGCTQFRHKILSNMLAVPVDKIHGTTARDHQDRIHRHFGAEVSLATSWVPPLEL